MAITDRTRKILWALSGNRCAMCQEPLIEARSECDREAVIGEECHIVGGDPGSPRFEPAFPRSEIDSAANLILLCPTHHAHVDKKEGTYTAEQLREIKREHEARTGERANDAGPIPQIRFVRTKEAIPKKLPRLTTGRELCSILEATHAMYFNHPPVLTEEDAELFGGFGQELQDWEMLLSDNDVHIRVKAELAFNDLLAELLTGGLVVFGGIEKQRIEGGGQGAGDWYVGHITVARVDDPAIVWEESSTAAGDGAATPARE
jgi:hypothetical protein